ncbi:hypothetical protein LUZ60_008270 [Juncus effusus]|nr:hypothetical protein LUZ60_008270 [Juncus effusus]
MSFVLSKFASQPLRRLLSTSAGAGANSGEKLRRISSELLSLSPSELSDFSTLLRLRLGVSILSSSSQLPSTAAGDSAQEPEEAKEKTAFDVRIDKFETAAKIKVIKEVRGFTDLGLKEAKELVEKVPVVVKKGVTKEEAEVIMAKLKAVGATVVLE